MTMPPGRPDLDQALKRLLQQAHDGLLTLLTPELHWRGERSPELPAVARQADLVWEVEDDTGTRGLLHIELQTKHDPEMGERLAEYLIRLWRRDHLPVRSIVIFLRAIPRVPQPPCVLEWMGNEVLRCHYEVVRLSGTRIAGVAGGTSAGDAACGTLAAGRIDGQHEPRAGCDRRRAYRRRAGHPAGAE